MFDMNNIVHENVPISKIDLDPNNPRDLKITVSDLTNGVKLTDPDFYNKQKEKITLETLSISIKNKGIINPIWVYKNFDNYQLVVGERRVLASILAGKETIPARVINSKIHERDLRVIQWIENIERSDLSLWERLKNIEMIINEHKNVNPNDVVNASLIKRILGCSLTHAINYFSVLYSNVKLKEAIQKNMVTNLEKASLLSSISDDEAFFNELLDLTIKGISLQAIKQRVRNHKELTQSIHLINIRDKFVKKSKKINFGSTQNLQVVKIIIEAVLKTDSKYLLHDKYFKDINWDDYKSVNLAFKKLLKILEDIV